MDPRSQAAEEARIRYESDSAAGRNAREMLEFSDIPLGQNCPQDCPQSSGAETQSAATTNPLGEPLAIEEVAQLLGCSAWTVRQRYLRQGLPYLQARPRGKLIFFREQVVAWTLKRQRQKGDLLR